MDVNGTRFHLLLNEDDWGACSDGRGTLRPSVSSPPDDSPLPDLVWNRERSELTLRPLLFQFVTPLKDTPPSLHVRRGAARDRYGNWYWIDSTVRRVQVFRADTQTVETFWPPPVELSNEQPAPPSDFRPREVQAPTLLRFLGLTITEEQYLVVGVLEPAGLLIFDLYSDNTPLQIVWPAEAAFSPFDMAAAPGGGVWILDRKNRRFWALDRHFNVLGQEQAETTVEAGGREDFQPRGVSAERRRARRTFPSGVSLNSSPISADDPIAIEALPDGSVLILDSNPTRDFSLIYRYRFQCQLGRPISTDRMGQLIQRDVKKGFRLSGFDFAFVPQHNDDGANVSHRLYVVADDGNQVFAFAVSLDKEQFDLEPLPDYLPMRMFGGKGLVAVGTELFYDFGDGWIPLVEQRRPRYLSDATLYTPLSPVDADAMAASLQGGESVTAFDGREPDCVWHRLMIDACLPPETEVRVSSRAANDERELALTEWQPEPVLYMRGGGTELPFLRRQTTAAAVGDGTWELLFQRARGRYLQLRLELFGNGRTTPRIRALRAYYPRFSYLEHYLPAVYSEDAQSASFLDRFLSNFEGLFTSLEDRVAAAQMLFDVRGAPTDSLEWLASWLGVALDPTWDESRRRLFIKYAPLFFLHRGTAQGLQMALRLALDECPNEEIFNDEPSTHARPGGIRIVEKYSTRQLPAVLLGDPTDTADLARPRLVERTVRWRPEQGRTVLYERFTEFLRAQGESPGKLVEYTITPPPDWQSQWTQFSRETLGFVPSSTVTEVQIWQEFLKRRYRNIEQLKQSYKAKWSSFAQVPLPGDMPLTNPRLRDWLQFLEETAALPASDGRRRWQDFLARRYQSVAKFNEAYGTLWAAFEVASLPEGLPPDGSPLHDWYQFEGIALPMHEGAHRFTVLLPMRNSAAFDSDEEQLRHSFARRIINLEKPAHTIFDMKYYWELFRIGEARLGEDTLIDLGSRAPQLMSSLILGHGHLAETYLPARRQIPGDRAVLGREQLKD